LRMILNGSSVNQENRNQLSVLSVGCQWKKSDTV
jgi:hypothetical protein